MQAKRKSHAQAYAIFGLGLLLTLGATHQVRRHLDREAATQFALSCDQLVIKLQERLDAYALILRASAGLFAASSTAVDRQEWRHYVETVRGGGGIPGVQGIGFAEAIPAAQLAAHVARVRAEGFPGYTVHPPGQRPLYTSIVYLEPFRGSNLRAFGYDMFSEPVRRAAMIRARDTGHAALSGKVQLVQETGDKPQAGTLMYFPVYRDGVPGGVLRGWVYMPYRMNDLMTGILPDGAQRPGGSGTLRIYDGPRTTGENLLFDSAPGADAEQRPAGSRQQRTIDFNGRRWLLVFEQSPGAPSGAGHAAAWSVLAGGLALDGLLLGLMLSRISTRSRAARIARRLVQEIRKREIRLQESEFRWKFAIEGTGDGLWDWNLGDDRVMYSRRWKEMLGYAENEIGDSLAEWEQRVHPEDRERTLAAVRDCLEGRTPLYTSEHRLRCKDGQWKWILDRGMVVSRDPYGRPLRMLGTHSDVTARREEQLRLDHLLVEQKALLDNQLIGLVTMRGGTLVWANPAFERMLGHERGALAGSSVRQLYPDEDSHRAIGAQACPLLEQGGRFRAQQQLVRKDGTPLWVDMSGVMLHPETGESLWGFIDITELKLAETQIRELAFHDPLTGLPNRRLLYDRLERTLAASRRSGRHAALMVLDLDRFKPLNDAHGHAVGDLLLVEVGQRLKHCVRAVDTVARFGGDEFVVMLDELDRDCTAATAHARAVAEKIRTALGEPYFLRPADEGPASHTVEHHCSASIGAVVFKDPAGSGDEILRRADEAMFRAKAAGRNQIRFHGADEGALLPPAPPPSPAEPAGAA